MKTKIVVIGLIENNKGEFLISQRSDPKIKEAHMKWDFVGGTIDFGEAPSEALKREVIEEANLDVEVGEMIPLCYSKVWKHEEYKIHAVVLCYQCKLIGGEIKIEDYKINDLRWIKKDDFKNYDFLPSINLFLEKSNFFRK